MRGAYLALERIREPPPRRPAVPSVLVRSLEGRRGRHCLRVQVIRGAAHSRAPPRARRPRAAGKFGRDSDARAWSFPSPAAPRAARAARPCTRRTRRGAAAAETGAPARDVRRGRRRAHHAIQLPKQIRTSFPNVQTSWSTRRRARPPRRWRPKARTGARRDEPREGPADRANVAA